MKLKTPTWIDVREALSDISREELISIISDLYKLRKENKRLLLSRYGQAVSSLDDSKPSIIPDPVLEDSKPSISPDPVLDESKQDITPDPSLDDSKLNSLFISPLHEFKLRISSAVNPKLARKISFKTARKVVNDYKKTSGDEEGVAELMVFYCEECAITIKRVGVWEQYAVGTLSIWQETLQYIQNLPRPQHIMFWEKLSTIQKFMGQAAWGVSDFIDIYMFKYSPYDELTKADQAAKKELLAPLSPEDMQ